MEKQKNTFWAVLGIAIVVLVLVTIAPAVNAGNRQTIETNGYYEVTAEPDKAIIIVEFEHIADTAEDAEEMNARTMEDIRNALKNQGLSEDNFKTISFHVGPNEYWDYDDGWIQEGYIAMHTLEITTDEITSIGKYITAAVDVGATNIPRVRFELNTDTENELKREALEKATLEARAKADGMASGLGARVVKVLSISDQNTYYEPYYRMMEGDMVMAASAQEIDTKISPRDLTVSANVYVTFEIQ